MLKYTSNKPIRLSKHAKEQCEERGATESEIVRTIKESEWHTAKNNKLECKYSFQFDSDWNGRHYAIKEVKPIFVEEETEIVVITVYTFYN